MASTSSLVSSKLPAWRAVGLALVILIGLGACGTEEPVEALRAPRVTHVRLEGPIDVGALALVTRGIRAAKAQDAEVLLLELDTPGGRLDVLWDMQKKLDAARADGLELACWVHDHAASAGAFIALSTTHVYMSPSGTIGSALPVLGGPDGLLPLPEDDGVREKELSFLRSQFRSMAEARGRPAALAAAMVDPDVEVLQVRIDNELRILDQDELQNLRDAGTPYEPVATIVAAGKLLNMTARQAVELRFVDGIAETLAQVLERLGYDANDASPPIERSTSEQAVVWLETLTPLLILAALVLGYMELKLPGFGLPGILSALCFLAVVGGKYMAGLAEVAHIVAVGLGLALIVLEIFVLPGTLWAGIAGGLLLAGGLVMASVGPGFSFSDPMSLERMLDTGLEYTIAAVLAIVIAVVLSRWLPDTPILRRAVLAPDRTVAFGEGLPENAALPALGARGTALTDLRPVGKVAIDGRGGTEYEARSLGPFLPTGVRLRVVEVGVGRLVVDAAPVNPEGENA